MTGIALITAGYVLRGFTRRIYSVMAYLAWRFQLRMIQAFHGDPSRCAVTRLAGRAAANMGCGFAF